MVYTDEILEFLGFKCHLEVRHFVDGQVELNLLDAETGEPVAGCTKDIPEQVAFFKKQNIVFVKNYSENEGILPLLIKHNIVEEPMGTFPAGYASLHICLLNEKFTNKNQ